MSDDGKDELKFHEDADRFLRMLSGLHAYAGKIKDLGQIKQAAAEAEKRRDEAVKKASEFAREHTDSAKAEGDRLRQKASAETAAKQQQAQKIVEQATSEAQKIKSSALADADRQRSSLELENKRLAEATSQAKKELADYRGAASAAKVEHDRLLADIRKSKENLEQIREEIAAFRKRFVA
jgi:hypothetical protein